MRGYYVAEQPNHGTVLVRAYQSDEQAARNTTENIYKLHLRQKLPEFRERHMREYKIVREQNAAPKCNAIQLVDIGEVRMPGQTRGRSKARLQPSTMVALRHQLENTNYTSISTRQKAWRLKRRLAEKEAPPPEGADVTVLAAREPQERCLSHDELGDVIMTGCSTIRQSAAAEAAGERLRERLGDRYWMWLPESVRVEPEPDRDAWLLDPLPARVRRMNAVVRLRATQKAALTAAALAGELSYVERLLQGFDGDTDYLKTCRELMEQTRTFYTELK